MWGGVSLHTSLKLKKARNLIGAIPSLQDLCRKLKHRGPELTASWDQASLQTSGSRVNPWSTMTLEGSQGSSVHSWDLVPHSYYPTWLHRKKETARQPGSYQDTLWGQGGRTLSLSLHPNSFSIRTNPFVLHNFNVTSSILLLIKGLLFYTIPTSRLGCNRVPEGSFSVANKR